MLLQDGLSSGHASDLDEEAETHPSALIPGQAPPGLTKRQVSSSRDSYIQQLEQLNMRNTEHGRETGEKQRQSKTNGGQQHLVTNILAMESLSPRLPPPSPAPEAPGQDSGHNVAAAIKDIKKAIQSTKTLQTPSVVNVTTNMTGVCDPWLPRAGERLGASDPVDRLDQPPPPPPAPLPPPPLSSCPPSPACSTPPPPPPVELQDESESEPEEERVPTPEIMKKEDEDLDTDQVIQEDFTLISLLPSLISNSRLRLLFYSPCWYC